MSRSSRNAAPRALVLNPPFARPIFRDHYCSSEAKSAYLWHPMDGLVQAACLSAAGHRVEAIDAIAEGLRPEDLRARVRRLGPEVAVVLVSQRSWRADRAILEMLRAEGVRAIAGSGDFLRFGTDLTAEAFGLVDLVLTDFTTPHLPASFAAGEPAGGGVATLDDVRAGRYADLGRLPLDYPRPDPRVFGAARYRLPYPGFTRFASVLTGYGCPHHCYFCHVGELGYRIRPVDAIIGELGAARAAGLRQVYFRDATLNASPRHVLAWTRRMAAEGLAMPWAAFASVRPMDGELAQAMATSGCRHLQIGVETLDEELRASNGKVFDDEGHRAFVDVCRRHGIQVTAHLILGLPGETPATIERTIAGLSRAPYDYVAINLAEDRPGLPWRQRGVRLPVEPGGASDVEAESRAGVQPAGLDPAGLDPATLEWWRSLGYRRFYLRPRRLATEALRRLRARDLADASSLARDVAAWLARRRP